MNKPIPESEGICGPIPYKKKYKISTLAPVVRALAPERLKYTFPGPMVKAFPGLHYIYSIKFYDEMINRLIAEVSCG